MSGRGALGRAARGALIGRRRFIAGAGAAAAAAALAACSRGDDGGGDGGDVVRFSNWPYYIDEETLAGFTDETGVRVRYTEDINDNDEFFAKIREPLSRERSIDRDLIVLTDSTAARVVRLGWAAELDRESIPNAANLLAELRDPSFDPGRRYTMPWVSGMTGIAYDADRTGRQISSVEDVFDPKFAGHVGMLTEMEDTLGLVMLGMGREPSTATEDDVKAAADRIAEARDRGQIRQFFGDDYGPALARGDVWITFAWSGDVGQLAEETPSLRFVVPEEGGLLWSDDLIVPKTAANPQAAFKLIDYYYRPDVAAKLIAEVQFISPVAGVREELERIDPELAANPLIVPGEDVRGRLRSFRALDADEESRFREIFLAVVEA